MKGSGEGFICDGLHRPHRRQASSHRYSTDLENGGLPVGAGLPAMRPVQGNEPCKQGSVT
ncbi:hypothetical protein C1X72_06010 [Pseudomonas sp. FW306-2-2C-D06B]|nr:hypothetical protein C1X72_06010 [Pseudomonas sp. FW306-2-2C-D06B]